MGSETRGCSSKRSGGAVVARGKVPKRSDEKIQEGAGHGELAERAELYRRP
jgi:hypothetical protein